MRKVLLYNKLCVIMSNYRIWRGKINEKITKFMKIIVLLIIGISALSINNAVKAEENVVLTLQLDPDTSKQKQMEKSI